ncbi:uncharacterized protein LOC101852094 [Aplysia californica]|uniref:Uncharacterized protein LOC101852094 n=1 Tax=Aplysia californica TaxID=6500 RepID=A0ABM0JNZ1_APLCA|nr:uncharacterized protein LOC101852094 [Aplysia californica]
MTFSAPVWYTAWLCLAVTQVSADINSGCPTWGCLSWGSFSLSAGVPSSNGQVKWSKAIEQIGNAADVGVVGRGCISNQDFVVCTTQRGYVSLDPSTGEQLWNYTAMSNPYLPLMDVYGDVIGIDKNNLVYVSNDGTPKHPIGIKIMQPDFGVMVSNNSILFLTATKTETAQIFTYDTDGIIDAAFTLKGSWERMNGTFVPCSHPVIAGNRAYIVTKFIPDGANTTTKLAWKRLFALDLLHQMAPRIVIAWYANFLMEGGAQDSMPSTVSSTQPQPVPVEEQVPIVTYFNNTVYINMIWPNKVSKREPYDSKLWAFRDEGAYASRLFNASSFYGPMAVFDTYDEPIKFRGPRKAERFHMVWVSSNSPAKLTGYRTQDGAVVQVIDVGMVSKLGPNTTITSKLSITRQNTSSNRDTIVLGAVDANKQAFLLAIEADPANAGSSLLWATKLSEQRADPSTWAVEGQVVNTAQPIPGTGGSVDFKLGLIAMVTETGNDYKKTYIKGVF